MKTNVHLSLVVWVCSWTSIGVLLLHLGGHIPMTVGGLTLLIPGFLAIALAGIHGRGEETAEFAVRFRAGLLGGLMGTIGYDLFRIPFHFAGMNPFAPIDAYGLWLVGGTASGWSTDLVGYIYHVSNGLAFGWIYSLIASRRAWGWALLWALMLEALAVATVFGLVFEIRQIGAPVIIAFAAHVFYGVPLGLVCQYPDHNSVKSSRSLFFVAGLSLLLGVWFTSRGRNVDPSPSLLATPNGKAAVIVASPNGVGPDWNDVNIARSPSCTLVNPLPVDVEFLVRDRLNKDIVHRVALMSGARTQIDLTYSGTYQVGLAISGKPVGRSVFIATHRDGRYQPDFEFHEQSHLHE